MTADRPVLRRAAALVAAVLASGALALPAAASKGARETMQATIDRVLVVLNDESLDSEGKLDAIEQVAVERFDLYTMSRNALLRSWSKFSKEQLDQYAAEFKECLANDYGSRIKRYDNQKVEILKDYDDGKGLAPVRTRIVGGKFDDARVDYRMRLKKADWQIVDVTVEGVSMVSSYREQFRDILNRGGPDHLLEKLRERNALGPVEEH